LPSLPQRWARRQDDGKIIACKLRCSESDHCRKCARVLQFGLEHRSGGNGVKEGLQPAMIIPLRLLLVEDRDAEPSHGLT
jgi:hypothetical protein